MANIINKIKQYKNDVNISGLDGSKIGNIIKLSSIAEKNFNSKLIKNILLQNGSIIKQVNNTKLIKLNQDIQTILKNNNITNFIDLGDGVVINLVPLRNISSAELNDVYTDYLQYTRKDNYPLSLDEYYIDFWQIKRYINKVILPYVNSILASNQFTINSFENVFISDRSQDSTSTITNTIYGSNSLVYANIKHINYLPGNIYKDGKYKFEYSFNITENIQDNTSKNINIDATFYISIDYIPELQIDFSNEADAIKYSLKIFYDSTVIDNLIVKINNNQIYSGGYIDFINDTTSLYTFTEDNTAYETDLKNTKNVLSKIYNTFTTAENEIKSVNLDEILDDLKVKIEYGVVALSTYNSTESKYIYRDLAKYATTESKISSVADLSEKVIYIPKFDHYYIDSANNLLKVDQSYKNEFKLINNGYTFVMSVYFISDIITYISTLSTISEGYQITNKNISIYKTPYGSKIETISYNFANIEDGTSNKPSLLYETVKNNLLSFKDDLNQSFLKDNDDRILEYLGYCDTCKSVDFYLKNGQLYPYRNGNLGDKFGIFSFNDEDEYLYTFHSIIQSDLFEVNKTLSGYLNINFDSGFGYIQGTLPDILNLNLKSLKPIYVIRNYKSSNINVLNLYLDKYYVYDDIDDIDNKSSIFAEFGSKLLYQNVEFSIKNTLAYTFNPDEIFFPSYLPNNIFQQSNMFYSTGAIYFYTTKLDCDIKVNDQYILLSIFKIEIPISLKINFTNIYQKNNLVYKNFNLQSQFSNAYSDTFLTKIVFDFNTSTENEIKLKLPTEVAEKLNGLNFTNLKFVIYPSIETLCNIRNCINVYNIENESCKKEVNYSGIISDDEMFNYTPSIKLPVYYSTGNIPLVVSNDLSSFNSLVFDLIDLTRSIKNPQSSFSENLTYDMFYFYKIPQVNDNIDYYPIRLVYTPYPFDISTIENKLKLEKDMRIEFNYNYQLYKLLTMISKNQKIYKISIALRVFIPGINNPNDPDRSNYQIFIGDVAKVTLEGNKIIVLAKTISIDYDKSITVTTTDFCPFEFKSLDCGYIGPETKCNKTQENCVKNFGSEDIAKTHFGGFLNISYYNKNVNIQRGG